MIIRKESLVIIGGLLKERVVSGGRVIEMRQHLIELRLRCAVGLDLAEMRLLEGIHAFGDGEVDVLHLAGRFIEFLHESVARI